MIDDEQLADRVVALGIGFVQQFTEGPRYSLALNREYLDAPSFVRDWRVAGALMEKCANQIYAFGLHYNHQDKLWSADFCTEHNDQESLPRAIIEACCEATEKGATAVEHCPRCGADTWAEQSKCVKGDCHVAVQAQPTKGCEAL